MKNGFSVIGWSRVWFAISGTLTALALVAVGVYGLNTGIDFTGGSLLEVTIQADADTGKVREVLAQDGFEAVVQETGEGKFLIRLPDLTREQHDQVLADLGTLGVTTEEHFESIGPVVGETLKQKTVYAVLLTLALIMAFVAYAFRHVSQPVASWKYAVITIVAAVHDVVIPLGVFAVLGHFFGYQIDTAFIAAILTILGYSINDTIIVFDRTRENLIHRRHSDDSFGDIVNMSVVQTFGRSINTSVTTLLALTAVFLFGGETLKPFALALIIGIVAGTYSSIFIASPLLVAWQGKK